MDGFEVRESGPGYLSLAIVELRQNQDLAREIRERFSPILTSGKTDLKAPWRARRENREVNCR